LPITGMTNACEAMPTCEKVTKVLTVSCLDRYDGALR
jgi:hypothetical protein